MDLSGSIDQVVADGMARLREFVGPTDEEIAHGEADKVLCEVLRAHGHNELVDLWESIDEWYS